MMGISRYRVTGKSMEPSLKEGDFVFSRTTFKFKKGDIVIAKCDGLVIIKRIDAIHGNFLVLKGDNPDAGNAYRIDKKFIKGKVFLHISGKRNK